MMSNYSIAKGISFAWKMLKDRINPHVKENRVYVSKDFKTRVFVYCVSDKVVRYSWVGSKRIRKMREDQFLEIHELNKKQRRIYGKLEHAK